MTLTFDMPMTLTLDFQGQIFQLFYIRKRLSAWHEMKGIWIQLIPCCRYYFKINSWWLIMTSLTHGPAANYCDVTMAHCSHGYLWTHDVEVGASWRDCDNLFVYFTYHFRTPVFQHGASCMLSLCIKYAIVANTLIFVLLYMHIICVQLPQYTCISSPNVF